MKKVNTKLTTSIKASTKLTKLKSDPKTRLIKKSRPTLDPQMKKGFTI